MTTTRSLSAVERHPQYEQIIEAMAANQTDQAICAWLKPSLDRTTLWRFRKTKFKARLQHAAQIPATVAQSLQDLGLIKDGAKISQAVKAVVAATTATLAADPIRSRIAAHQQTIDDSLTKAKADDNLRAIAALIGTDLKGLELDARLTGRLDGPSHVTVNNLAIVMSPKSEALEPAIDAHCEPVSDAEELAGE